MDYRNTNTRPTLEAFDSKYLLESKKTSRDTILLKVIEHFNNVYGNKITANFIEANILDSKIESASKQSQTIIKKIAHDFRGIQIKKSDAKDQQNEIDQTEKCLIEVLNSEKLFEDLRVNENASDPQIMIVSNIEGENDGYNIFSSNIQHFQALDQEFLDRIQSENSNEKRRQKTKLFRNYVFVSLNY